MIEYAERLPPGKSIKLLDDNTIRKTTQCSEKKTLVFMEAIIKHFIVNPHPMVVPLYSFQIISKSFFKNNTYSYTMMRLGILSNHEKDLIDFVGDMHDSYGAGACLQHIIYPGAGRYPELFEFLKTIVEQQRYWDIHSGNIMMDPFGKYRIIDIEGFIKTPLVLSENDWISRD